MRLALSTLVIPASGRDPDRHRQMRLLGRCRRFTWNATFPAPRLRGDDGCGWSEGMARLDAAIAWIANRREAKR